jgi:uncharacterized protein YjbI with pentapeptide repeats
MADLSYAYLTGAYLVYADLSGAKLLDATLSNANLNKTDLRGADLRGAKGLTQTQLHEACGNGNTELPEGFTLKPCATN